MNLTVTYKRTMQVVQYEPATIETTLSDIPIDDSKDIQDITRKYTEQLSEIVECLLLEQVNGCNDSKTAPATGSDNDDLVPF